MPVFPIPVVVACNAGVPTAVLNPPVVNEVPALCPIMTLYDASLPLPVNDVPLAFEMNVFNPVVPLAIGI
jgi:hypothetical protein